MTLYTWWAFFGAVFFLSGTPGPNMLHVLRRSVSFGARRSMAAMAGCLTAVVVVLALSAAGLSAVLIASPRLFDALRYAGVAYLVYLGIKAWRGSDTTMNVGDNSKKPAMSLLALFRGGLIIGFSNPKLLLFAAAFLPQFLNKSTPQLPQFLILVTTFAAAEAFWYGVYGLGGQSLAAYLTRPTLRKAFDRITGGVFVAFGAALLRFRL